MVVYRWKGIRRYAHEGLATVIAGIYAYWNAKERGKDSSEEIIMNFGITFVVWYILLGTFLNNSLIQFFKQGSVYLRASGKEDNEERKLFLQDFKEELMDRKLDAGILREIGLSYLREKKYDEGIHYLNESINQTAPPATYRISTHRPFCFISRRWDKILDKQKTIEKRKRGRKINSLYKNRDRRIFFRYTMACCILLETWF